MNRSISIVFAALIAAGLTYGADAGAADSVAVRHIPVRYGDLNLSTPQGAAMLRDRIEHAAAQACGGSPIFATNYRMAPRFERAAFEECRSNARNQAYAELRARLAPMVAGR